MFLWISHQIAKKTVEYTLHIFGGSVGYRKKDPCVLLHPSRQYLTGLSDMGDLPVSKANTNTADLGVSDERPIECLPLRIGAGRLGNSSENRSAKYISTSIT